MSGLNDTNLESKNKVCKQSQLLNKKKCSKDKQEPM